MTRIQWLVVVSLWAGLCTAVVATFNFGIAVLLMFLCIMLVIGLRIASKTTLGNIASRCLCCLCLLGIVDLLARCAADDAAFMGGLLEVVLVVAIMALSDSADAATANSGQ